MYSFCNIQVHHIIIQAMVILTKMQVLITQLIWCLKYLMRILIYNYFYRTLLIVKIFIRHLIECKYPQL